MEALFDPDFFKFLIGGIILGFVVRGFYELYKGIQILMKYIHRHGLNIYNSKYHKMIYILYIIDILIVSIWGLVDTFYNTINGKPDHAIFYISIFTYLVNLNKVIVHLEEVNIKVYSIFLYFMSVSAFLIICLTDITNVLYKFIIVLLTMIPYIIMDYHENKYYGHGCKSSFYYSVWLIGLLFLISCNIYDHFNDTYEKYEHFIFFMVYFWIDLLVIHSYYKKMIENMSPERGPLLPT
jgi:hypothetical protein